MKKVLVLMMVLGFAASANAAIMISLDGDTTVDEVTIFVSDWIVVDIYEDGMSQPPDYICYLDIGPIADGDYTLANARLGPGAGDLPSSFVQGTYAGYDDFEFTQAWAVGSTPTAGIIFEVDLHCESVAPDGMVQVNLYNAGGTLVDSAVIYQDIPEPATIMLLGLGGLLLRRRK